MSAHIPETSTTHHQLLPLHKLTNTPDHEASSSSLSVSIDDALGNNSRKGDKHLLSKKNSNCNRLRKVFSTLRRNFSPSPTADSCATSDSSSTATNTSSLFYPARIILEKGGEDADALNAAAQHPTRIAVNVKPGPLLTKFQRSKRVARRRWSEEDNESSCSNSQETFSEVKNILGECG